MRRKKYICASCKPLRVTAEAMTLPILPMSELFGAAGAGHEVADGVAGRLVLMEDGSHLLGDGHFHAITCGEAERGGGGAHAFGDLAVEAGENLRQLAALAELDADGAVARQAAGAGEHEVADAGEAGHGFAAAAAGDSEAGDLRDAARDQRGSGVVAELESGDDAGGERDDVLERAAELGADDILVAIDAQETR